MGHSPLEASNIVASGDISWTLYIASARENFWFSALKYFFLAFSRLTSARSDLTAYAQTIQINWNKKAYRPSWESGYWRRIPTHKILVLGRNFESTSVRW